jgi:hypothetical protein
MRNKEEEKENYSVDIKKVEMGKENRREREREREKS